MHRPERRHFLAELLVAVPALVFVAERDQSAPVQGPAAGIMVPSGEDRFHATRAIGVSMTTFRVAAADTRGALFAMEQANTKHGDPPLHLHRDVDELWYVTAGEYLVAVGGTRFRARAGDCVLGPRGVPHRGAFVGDTPGRMLITFTPAGRMQEWFARPRKPGAYLTDQTRFREFGMELLGPPLPV